MISRLWFGGFLFFLPTVSCAQGDAGGKLSTALVIWENDLSTPAVCLGRDDWFVSILPEDVEKRVSDGVVIGVGEQTYSSTILFLHPSLRLCLIQAPSALPDFQCHPLADPGPPVPGTPLHCRTHQSSCRTTVAGKDFHYLGKPLPVPMLRVRIAESGHLCSPGTPLINAEGELEGILTSRVDGVKDQAHAIPVAQIHKLVHEFEQFKRSGKVWVGMVFHNMSTTPEVLEVREKSPAKKAGVIAGDVILRLNDHDIESLAELAELIRSLPAGKRTSLTVLRGLERVELTFVPQFASNP